MRALTAFRLILSIAVAVVVGGSIAHAQTLKVSALTTTAHLYDTLPGLSAEPRDTRGRIAGTATIRWNVRQTGPVMVARSADVRGRTAYIVAAGTGTAWARAIWARTDGDTLRDSVRITVIGPRTVRAQLAFGFHRDSFTGRIVYDTVRKVGERFCVYGLAWDRRGHLLTGRPVTSITITDTTIARYDGWGTVCPDTTVNPSRVVR